MKKKQAIKLLVLLVKCTSKLKYTIINYLDINTLKSTIDKAVNMELNILFLLLIKFRLINKKF